MAAGAWLNLPQRVEGIDGSASVRGAACAERQAERASGILRSSTKKSTACEQQKLPASTHTALDRGGSTMEKYYRPTHPTDT